MAENGSETRTEFKKPAEWCVHPEALSEPVLSREVEVSLPDNPDDN
jgi:hypothetical protein